MRALASLCPNVRGAGAGGLAACVRCARERPLTGGLSTAEANGEESTKCKALEQKFHDACLPAWVKYFEVQRQRSKAMGKKWESPNMEVHAACSPALQCHAQCWAAPVRRLRV